MHLFSWAEIIFIVFVFSLCTSRAYPHLLVSLDSICPLLSSQTTAKRVFYDVCSDPVWKINLVKEYSCFHLPPHPPYEKSHVWLCSAYYDLMCTTRTSETHGYQYALRRPCTWHSGIIGRDGPHSPFVGPQDYFLAIIPPTFFAHLSPGPLQCLISPPFT